MGRKEELEQELEELWQEHDNHYEAAKEIMMTIHMVEADLEKLDERT